MTADATQENPPEYSEWTAGYLASQTEKYDRFGVGRLYIDITGYLTDGIIFSRLMYWFTPNKKGKQRTKIARNGYRWVAKNYDQWWEECRIDARTARASIGRMVKSGLLIKAVYKFGKKPTTHLRINWATFEKLAKEHLSITVEDKRSLKRSKRQKMSERPRSVPAENVRTMDVAENVRTIDVTKNGGTYSMITESLNTTLNTTLSQPPNGVATDALADEFDETPVTSKALAAYQQKQATDHLSEPTQPITPETKRESAEPVQPTIVQAKALETPPPVPVGSPVQGLTSCKPLIPDHFYIVHKDTAVGPFKGFKTANTYKFSHTAPGTIEQGAAIKSPVTITPPEAGKPDMLFAWVATNIIKNDPQVAYDSKRLQRFIFSLMAPIVNAEKRLLKVAVLPQTDRDRVAGEMDGWRAWYPTVCPGCSIPQDLTTFEKYINQWYAAGKPGGDRQIIGTRRIETDVPGVYMEVPEWSA